jgi:CBS domain containing-hemolysin-like protein
VAQGSLDNCIGIVKVRSLLTAHMGREPIDLPALEDEDEPSFVTRQVRMSITHWLAS